MIVLCELCGYEEDMEQDVIEWTVKEYGFIQCPNCDDGELEAVR